MTIREIKSRKHKEYEQNRKDIYYFIVKYEKRKGEMPQIKTIAEELDLSPVQSRDIYASLRMMD